MDSVAGLLDAVTRPLVSLKSEKSPAAGATATSTSTATSDAATAAARAEAENQTSNAPNDTATAGKFFIQIFCPDIERRYQEVQTLEATLNLRLKMRVKQSRKRSSWRIHHKY